MSGVQRIMAPRVATAPSLSLLETLRGIDPAIPEDQSQVRHMMEAARIGISLTENPMRLRYFVARWRSDDWRVESLDEYLAGRPHTYGRPIPARLHDRIQRIRRGLPEAHFWVYSLRKDDPFVEVSRGLESVIVCGWTRELFNERIFF